MPRNGSGTYALPIPPTPFVTGTTISAPDMNTTQNDIASALTGSVARDGQSPLTGNWPVGGYSITGINALSATSLTVSGTTTLGAVTVSSLTLTNATVGGTLAVTGAATLSSTLAVTGTITGSSTITGTTVTVTGSGTPANGINLPAANTIGINTNSTLRFSVNASGALGIGASPNYGTSGYVLTSAGNSAAPTWSAATSYTPTGTLGTPLNASFPIGSGVFVTKAGTGTTGVGGDLTVTFGTAFPNACVAIIPALEGAPPNANTYAFVTSKSASGAVLSAQSDSGNPRASVPLTWIAVGY